MCAYPIKDWKKEAEYPEHGDLSQWAWEFLRRNHEYQIDMGRYAQGEEGFKGIYEFTDRWEWALNEPVVCNYDAGNGELVTTHLFRVLQDKYRLGALSDIPPPTNDKVNIVCNTTPPILFSFGNDEQKKGNSVSPKCKYDVVVQFDISKPIDHQLHRVKEILEARALNIGIKHKNKRKQLSMYPKYIRVLDALASGAKRDEIARVLIPHINNGYDDEKLGNKTILNWIKEAERLSQDGYGHLYYLGTKT